MNNYYTTITLTPQEIADHPFVSKDGKADFYRFITDKVMSYHHNPVSYDEIKSLDCRKINVAKNIQEAWFDYAKANDMNEENLCMLLCMSGPKALEHLRDNYVEIEANCIEW